MWARCSCKPPSAAIREVWIVNHAASGTNPRPLNGLEGTTVAEDCPSKIMVPRVLMHAGHKPRLWLWLAVALVAANSNRAEAKDDPAAGNPAELVSRAVQNEVAANTPSGM